MQNKPRTHNRSAVNFLGLFLTTLEVAETRLSPPLLVAGFAVLWSSCPAIAPAYNASQPPATSKNCCSISNLWELSRFLALPSMEKRVCVDYIHRNGEEVERAQPQISESLVQLFMATLGCCWCFFPAPPLYLSISLQHSFSRYCLMSFSTATSTLLLA